MHNLPDYILKFIIQHPLQVQGVLYLISACLVITFIFILIRFRLRHNRTASDNIDKTPESVEISGKINKVKKPGPGLIIPLVSAICLGIAAMVFFLYTGRIGSVRENPRKTGSEYTFGIDVSSWQGRISWDKVVTSHHPIKFVFVRATMGINKKDKQFNHNWRMAKRHGFLRGAYHYYRPDENSVQQFTNFASTVKIEAGDLPPILDIEDLGHSSPKIIREGVLNWLQLAEARYGMKPILYTNRKFYHNHLRGHVSGYPLWIASYSGKHKLFGIDWTFHQFTEHVRVKGISTHVDGNDFHGQYSELLGLCKKTAP